MKWIYFLIIFTYCVPSLYATQQPNTEQHSANSDSLQGKTLEELTITFWTEKNLDSLYKIKLANAYIAKARKLGNVKRIADGYQMYMYLHKGQYETYLKYSDSIIDITKDLKNSHYPTTGYIFKGGVLKDMERYNEALESLLKAKEIAEENDFEIQTMVVEYRIAELKTVLGKDFEAFQTYKKHYSIFSKQDSIENDHQLYIGTLYKLGDYYSKIKKYDSARFFLNKGIKYSLDSRDRHFYPELVFTAGISSYYQKKYTPAIDSLQKTLKLLDGNVDDIKVRMSYLYLGKSYKELNKQNEALHYLQKVDSVTSESNYRLEIREAFELLKEYYRVNNNKSELVELLERWIHYEKIRQEKYNRLDKEIVEKYDVPALIKEKEMLLSQAIDNNKTSKYRMIIFGGITISVISLLYFILYKSKKTEFEEVLDEQLEKVKELEKHSKKPKNPGLELSEELKLEILQKLNLFEKELGYLKNDLTLVKVSKKLKTNSTYLSKVINLEKQKNFTNYVNDLRVDYCIEQIKTNKKFRQYAISAMASEVGFNNIQSFAKAFSKKVGCNPAEYISNLDNELI